MTPMPETIRRCWPIHDLRIVTPRLTLRLLSVEEVGELADVACAELHYPGEGPFLNPWTEVEPEERALTLLAGHRDNLSFWEPDNWRLGFAVMLGDDPVGW